MRSFCSYFKLREIIYAEKVMIGAEPTLNLALEKDFWCTQNYKDISLVIGSSLVCNRISVSALQPLVNILSFPSSEKTGNSIFGYQNALIKTKYVQHCWANIEEALSVLKGLVLEEQGDSKKTFLQYLQISLWSGFQFLGVTWCMCIIFCSPSGKKLLAF